MLENLNNELNEKCIKSKTSRENPKNDLNHFKNRSENLVRNITGGF